MPGNAPRPLHELDGLQKITAQNVRLRVEPKLFCHSWAQYGDYPTITLPDGRVEIALGDLVSDESREFVLLIEVLPLPLLPGGEAKNLLDETRRKVDSENLSPRDLKNLVYESRTRPTTRILDPGSRKKSKPRPNSMPARLTNYPLFDPNRGFFGTATCYVDRDVRSLVAAPIIGNIEFYLS